jgi:tRNA-2-methylthio-N6-dimethylallyladenosine synthase
VAIDRFTDDVPEDVKRRRNNALLAVQAEVSAANNRAMIGQTVQVLVEGESKLVSKQTSYPASKVELGWETRRQGHFSDPVSQARTQLVGRTGGDQVVVFDGDPALKGELLRVTIIDARNLTLFARPVAAEMAPA